MRPEAMSLALFAVKRALGLGIALAVSIHEVNAKEIILTCRNLESPVTRRLTIDLDNRRLAFLNDDGTANSLFDIRKVSEFAITAILADPNLLGAEEIFVLNRETGQYITTIVSLRCTDKKCLRQTDPTIDTSRGNCRPPIL
jgi:hypothetical protein